ncbi:MAG TPA: hypothetical protein VK633_06050, partial [Verrucomicrobiae bacterium]|nr:hypothetical protein [Verrucomicrobiae bacterium]
ENPATQHLPAGKTATFHVGATSPDAISYQWQRAASGTTNFVDIAGATQASYTSAALAAADNGSKFRVKVTSGAAQTTTPEAELTVDATIPTLTAATGGINFNSIYLSFSEPMNLQTLGNTNNYKLAGGITLNSVVALDPQNVRLITSTQNVGANYSVTINNIEDVAGNKVTDNSARGFSSFAITTNAVGVEIWRGITGSTVQELRNDARFPGVPDEDYAIATFDTVLLPVLGRFDNNTYGGRMRAWLTPEETGEYEFFMRADDQGELRISTDDSFANFDDPDFLLNELPTATDTLAGDPFQESGVDLSTSIPIALVKGKRYAVQALWKEANGTDHLQIAWRKVGDATPADQLLPIPGRLLSYYGPVTSIKELPKITQIALANGKVELAWTGTVLQSSADLKTWADETGLSSPISVTPQGRKFFRVKN